MRRKDTTAFRKRVEAYKNGTPINEIYDGGYIKEPVITPDPLYNEYINSLPDNQRLTPESLYRSHRYWELNDKPKNFAEAIGKGMFEYNTGDNSWHTSSAALNKNTGEYEFMKPNWHSTKMYEDAWYYSKEGEGFRSEYTKKPGIAYDKYVPKHKNGKLPGYKIGHNPSNAKMNSDGTFTDDYTKVFEDMYVTPLKTDLKRGSYTLNNFPYYLQHRTDWTKPFMSSGTNERGLELVNPEFDILLGGRQLSTEIFKSFSKNANKIAANEIAKELNRGIEQNAILRNYNKIPANKDIGSAYDYLDFLDNIYPNSKINGVFYHGGPKGIQKFKSAKELGSTNKNINSGTKSRGIYFADDEGLGLYYARGFKKQNRELYSVRVNAESPIRYETDNWYLDKFVGNEDLRFRPGSITDKWYDKLDLKTKDAIYHTKSSNPFENGELVVFDGDNIHIMGTPKESLMFRSWKQNPIYAHKPILDQIPLLPQLYDKSLKNYAKASVPGLFLGGIPIAPYLLYLYEKNRRKRYKQDDDVKPTTLKSKQITE